MNIDSSFASGVYGLQKAMNSMDQNANTIAQSVVSTDATASSTDKDQTDALIGLKMDELQGKAAAKVISASDKMIGSLLDITV